MERNVSSSKFIDLNFYAINLDNVLLIMETVTNPVREALKEKKKEGKFVNLAGNETVRTVLELRDGRWVGVTNTASEVLKLVRTL